MVSKPLPEFGPAGIVPFTVPENQAQLVAKSQIILATLLLIGVGIINPVWVTAQDSGGEAVVFSPAESAAPADSRHRQPYQFFPRAAAVGDSANRFTEIQQVSADESSPPESESATDLGSEAWDATERFSPGRFREAIPVQYPLDNSVYEGEDPLGRDPHDAHAAEGQWRGSSVHRPDETLAPEDLPWVEWYKFYLTTQTLPSGGQGLGITSIDMKGTLKFARWPFLFVSPRAGFHFLDGPSTTDLPARLYDFSLDTTVYLPLNDRWTIQASATPSYFSDLQATKNAFRMVGRGLVFYRWSPKLQLAGGFLYLGRKDIVALPAAGFIYTPNDDVKLDIMFPKPRMAYRYTHDEHRERWVYFTGELGGGSWAVQRASGIQDVATYRDLQLLLGIEHKQPDALNWQLEGGYVFSRKVQYLSMPGAFTTLPATAVLRVVLTF